MDEAELTRKAVEEIMREMNLEKEVSKLPQIQERKKNPLGRPNKDFLDRTINSVMTHNKRQYDRTYKNCQRKLKDLDSAKDDNRITTRRKRRYSQSSTDTDSSSSDEDKKQRTKKNKKTKKKKKHKKETSSSSSSSSPSILSSSSSSESINSDKNSDKRKKHKKRKSRENPGGDEYYGMEDPSMGLYMNPNINMALAAAVAYNHMNQLLQSNCQVQEDFLKEELESGDDKVDIPSDLSLTYHSSESEDLNISLNSSSAEEDENGILTFNLSSDEERKTKSKSGKSRKSPVAPTLRDRKSKSSPVSTDSESDNDIESVHSHISLKSDDSRTDKTINIVHVSILSSSSSDSDCQEVVMTESSNVHEGQQNENAEKMALPLRELKEGDITDESVELSKDGINNFQDNQTEECNISLPKVGEEDTINEDGVVKKVKSGETESESKENDEFSVLIEGSTIKSDPPIKDKDSVMGETIENETTNINMMSEASLSYTNTCKTSEFEKLHEKEDEAVKSNEVDPKTTEVPDEESANKSVLEICDLNEDESSDVQDIPEKIKQDSNCTIVNADNVKLNSPVNENKDDTTPMMAENEDYTHASIKTNENCSTTTKGSTAEEDANENKGDITSVEKDNEDIKGVSITTNEDCSVTTKESTVKEDANHNEDNSKNEIESLNKKLDILGKPLDEDVKVEHTSEHPPPACNHPASDFVVDLTDD